jgi:hypothetical protein
MNLEPGTRSVFAHLTLTFLGGAATGPVEQTLGTSCDRADPRSVRQNAFPAGAAILLKPSDIPVHPDEYGIQSRKDRSLGISVGKKLDPGPASHGQQGFIASGDLIQLRIKITIALSLYGKPIRLERGALLLESALKLFVQESDFPLTAGHADGGTAPASHIQDLLETLCHLFDFVKRLSFRNNHLSLRFPNVYEVYK